MDGKYSVVHNGIGPYHLVPHESEKSICACGIKPPGLHSTFNDCEIVSGILTSNNGSPENILHFCKKCLCALKVDAKQTMNLFNAKFKTSYTL